MDKKKVILVTDGDESARHAIETAANQIGGRCISLSSGNPTQLSGSEIFELVMKTPYDPVVVMFDDNGKKGPGYGERALSSFASYPQLEIIGAIAVASDCETQSGVEVNFSINRNGEKKNSGVDKLGFDIPGNKVFGDTVEILSEINIPVIVGIGDPGKMDGQDAPLKGAPITTKALKEIVSLS